MIPLQVFISGLILLLPVTGAVDSYTVVQGLVGHPVTLPCTNSTPLDGFVPSCWGRGKCRDSYCLSSLIWTNGHKVTYQRKKRYQLKENISEGNVSLTIETTDMSDGGHYCCIVEIPGAFQFGDYLLEVKQEITSPPARPTTTGRPTTISTGSTHEPSSTRVSASTPTPAHTRTHKPGAVDSYTAVQGLVGHPVTLPCTYSPSLDGHVPSCWGRGKCRDSYCISTLIWTNRYNVTYQRSKRYQLKGNISEGNVSLTIENTGMSDGGHYCCIVEIPGAFQFGDYLLEVKPEITSPPTRPTTTGRPTTTETHNYFNRITHEPTSTRISASTPTPGHTRTHKPDWNNTVTSSDNSWDNSTAAIPPQKPQKNLTKGFYVGISIAAPLLLLLVSTVVITRYIVMKRKSGFLSFPVPKIRSLQNTVIVRSKSEDKVYIIEGTSNPEEQSQWPSEVPSA
ncbi:LOW QUALITY PROTEIN: T-cell immunoglobulin and mucin domain-containing protein 2-like [Apodemus sylvaticus]|uniref:LOW QUALITY PROTEIN: T-cell immunoglobulin and mucin domain-containing protein 2-like n=1 Tax=Apodemus sylvaticus TaxID=10129 RepID=UPI002241B712|nr:LOW QUALITY PROTEIN: T-cell immunoglobulin and mucin domain-containing protein 2-like [Apodemus sylvaticus]